MEAGSPRHPRADPPDPAVPVRPLRIAVYAFALTVPLGIAPAQIFLALGLLALLGSLALRRRPWIPSPLDLPVLGFLIVVSLAAVFSSWPQRAAAAALGFWTVLPFLLAREIAADLRTTRLALRLLLVGALLAAGMGIAEGLLGDVPGFTEFLDAVDLPDPRLRGARVTGFFSHPMTFAGQQAILLAVFTALAAWSFGASGSTGIRGWSRRLAPPALMALALVFTGGRAAFAAAAIVLLVVGGAASTRTARVAAAGALGALGLSFAMGGSVLAERLRGLGSEIPAISRLEMWHAALGMLRENPLLGIGPGLYRLEIPRWLDVSTYHPAHAHSTPFQIAAETGLAGLAAWLTIWAAFFGVLTPRAWRMVRRGDGRAGVLAAAWAGVAVFLLIGLFEYDLGDGEVAMLAFFLAGLPFGRAFQPRAHR